MGKLQTVAPDMCFIPKHLPPIQSDINLLNRFLNQSRKLFVLTGAGISTESGIPDYRSEKVGLYARTNHRPVLHSEFLNSETVRRRYWARNYVGWERLSHCAPNFTHRWLMNLEIVHCRLQALVTQNVDSLHSKAGSNKVVELHGSAYTVSCLSCSKSYTRHDVQEFIKKLNPDMTETSTTIRPDGDVEIADEAIRCFKAPLCTDCGGPLKPDIVFFGDNVPQSRVDLVQNHVAECDAVLVLGSSLYVYSGFRIILQAAKEGKRVAIVNIGSTRGDKYADIKVAAKCGDVLKRMTIN